MLMMVAPSVGGGVQDSLEVDTRVGMLVLSREAYRVSRVLISISCSVVTISLTTGTELVSSGVDPILSHTIYLVALHQCSPQTHQSLFWGY